jgi:hypothetical protein
VSRPAVTGLLPRFNAMWTGEPASGCWLWLGTGSRGYGSISVDRTHRRAHRVAYELFKGQIPHGADIDHTCKVKCCVNPAHLEAVTHQENCKRRNAGKAACPKGHPYSGINVRGDRICSVCAAEQKRTVRAALSQVQS